MKNTLKIHKIRDVNTPARGTSKSAGIDLYVPNDFPGTHYLAPGQSVSIPSGLYFKIPTKHALLVMNRSGIALRKSLQVGACLIDEDYQGEVFVHLINIGDDVQEINPGEKLVQLVLIPVNYIGVEVADNLTDLYGGKVTERGENGFGSTDKTES